MRARPHVGLVGCGGWGRHILRDLKALGARVTCVARGERSRANAATGGADAIVDTLDDLPAVDGAVVATPSDSHGTITLALARRGLPVFVEKPLTSDLAQARAIVDAAPDRVFVMDKWRYHGGIRRLAAIAGDGSLGAVIGLRSVRLGWSMTHNEVDPVWNLLPHDLSICLHVLGVVPKLIWAAPDPLGPLGGGVVALLGETDGPRALVECSAHHPVNRRSVILACEGGTLTLNASLDDHLVLRRGPPGDAMAHEERVAIPTGMPLEAELAAFLDHLGGGPPPLSSARDGLATVERCCEIRAAAGIPG
ncbi:MAG: Gfo/Idh/MocA family oxidoreductase [Azospirillaceae bacterium]